MCYFIGSILIIRSLYTHLGNYIYLLLFRVSTEIDEPQAMLISSMLVAENKYRDICKTSVAINIR